MSTSIILALLLLGGVLVAGSILLRTYSGGKYEIKTSDLVFLVLPLVLTALATGKLKGVDAFGVKADFSAVWTDAAKTSIEKQVAQTTVGDAIEAMAIASKGSDGDLESLRDRKIEALTFRLGRGGYYGASIAKYFNSSATLSVTYPTEWCSP